LTAAAQKVIGQDASHHGLTDGNRANADAGIMVALDMMSVSAPLRSAVRRGHGIDEVGFTASGAIALYDAWTSLM